MDKPVVEKVRNAALAFLRCYQAHDERKGDGKLFMISLPYMPYQEFCRDVILEEDFIQHEIMQKDVWFIHGRHFKVISSPYSIGIVYLPLSFEGIDKYCPHWDAVKCSTSIRFVQVIKTTKDLTLPPFPYKKDV